MADIQNDKLSALLSDPEGLKAISSIAKTLINSPQNTTSQNTESSGNTSSSVPIPQADTQAMPVSSPIPKASAGHQIHNQFDDRVNLLRSIKPYLAENRQSRVDSLVRAISIAKLINTYNENPDIFKF